MTSYALTVHSRNRPCLDYIENSILIVSCRCKLSIVKVTVSVKRKSAALLSRCCFCFHRCNNHHLHLNDASENTEHQKNNKAILHEETIFELLLKREIYSVNKCNVLKSCSFETANLLENPFSS